MERDNLVLDRWELQCRVVLKLASWDAQLGWERLHAVHRGAMLHLSSDFFQLLLPPESYMLNSNLWTPTFELPNLNPGGCDTYT